MMNMKLNNLYEILEAADIFYDYVKNVDNEINTDFLSFFIDYLQREILFYEEKLSE